MRDWTRRWCSLVAAAGLAAGCAANRTDGQPVPRAPYAEPAAGSSAGSGRGEPRGNTPPGMDRSGSGPAEGAIKDPSGAATGTPDRR